MTLCKIVWGLTCVVSISVGQILFKLASRKIVFNDYSQVIFDLVRNKYLIIGLVLYGLTTMLWIGLLRIVDLRYAYPLMALAFVIVPILAKYFLGEDLKFNSVLGGLIIIAGVFVSVR
jgi:undecaprenyl phosphate-alpha-L-ara4N flippase subunit ArnE